MGASRVDFGLVILPIRSDQTIDYTYPGDYYELVSLVTVILRYLHEVTMKGSLTIPGTNIGQTHLGSLEGNPQLLRGSLH